MLRSPVANVPTLSAAILAGILGFGTLLMLRAAPAAAYDDDVDVVCFDYEDANGNSETECQTIDELSAECALVDPEYTSDVCGGLLENRRPLGLTTTTKHRRDDNGDKDRDRGRGRDTNNGGNRGGSGPNG
jgi:hypothetical protein